MRYFYLLLTLAVSFSLSAQQVIMTGVLDGTAGGTPRAVELYIDGTVDLSAYQLVRYANGSDAPGNPDALSGTYTDEFVYVVNNTSVENFQSAFGSTGKFANQLTGNGIQGTGDDIFAVTLLDGTIVDQAGGVIGERVNLYQDSYIYRVSGTGPDVVWTPENWLNVGINDVLDGKELSEYATIVPFSSYTPGAAGPSITVAAGDNLAEPTTNGGFTVTLSEPATSDLTITYTVSGTATVGTDYVDPKSGSIFFEQGATVLALPIEVLDDSEAESVETITITLDSATDGTYSLGDSATISIIDDEPVTLTLISAVQGTGMSSPSEGQFASVRGVVVGDFQGASGVGLGGFFVQEEDSDADGDSLSSEGIWIFQGDTGVVVNVGDLVTVTGAVQENRGLTQLDATVTGGKISIESIGNSLPTTISLFLPLTSDTVYEAVEGMRITLAQPAYVTNNFSLGRFGEVEVSVGQRLIQFTECNAPDADALAIYNAEQTARRLIVDDGRSGSNVYPLILPDGTELSATNTLRAGAVFTGLTGIIDERFTGYRLQPTGAGVLSENERPTTSPEVGGNLKIVGMNVLNYFTTLGRAGRGADNQEEFDRQEAKIVAAICELDADILGLVEIENDTANETTQALIAAINASCGKQYTAVAVDETGTDQIKVQLIYDAAVVDTVGASAFIQLARGNRVPVAQTFEIIEATNSGLGEQITVVVNHFKSKGGSCGDGDDDLGGAGSCNGTRVAAANTLRTWLATDPTGTGVSAQLVIGDLNAYRMEEPIISFTDAGYIDLVTAFAPGESFPCGSRPSYVFDGEWGSLDYALASPELAPFVTGAAPWEVNASEPTVLDYNTEDRDSMLYDTSFYRFSDHNPVVVGVQLGTSVTAQITSFTGEAVDGDVVLAWTTSAERGTSTFEVQRQGILDTFNTIGTVTAAGDSDVELAYTFTDEDATVGSNVYRLRTLAVDGSVAISNTVTVSVEATNSVRIARTGAGSYRLSEAPIGTVYALTTVGGSIVQTGRVDYATADVDGTALPAGIYFLGLTLPDGQLKVFKLLFGR